MIFFRGSAVVFKSKNTGQIYEGVRIVNKLNVCDPSLLVYCE